MIDLEQARALRRQLDEWQVAPDCPPRVALAEAMRLTGAGEKELGRVGWGGPIHDLLHNPHLRDLTVQHNHRVLSTNTHGEMEPEPLLLAAEWTTFLARLWYNAGAPEGKQYRLPPNRVTRRTLLFPDLRGLRYVYFPPAASAHGPALYVRALPNSPLGLDDLVRNETLPARAAALVRLLVRIGSPVIVAGASGSGKTTFLAALLRWLQESRALSRLLIAEASHEIPLVEPGAIRLEENPEEKLWLEDLAWSATQVAPDVLVIGECTRGEAYWGLKAFGQGIQLLTTCHADSGPAVPAVFASLAGENDKAPARSVILERMAEQGIICIHLARKQNGRGERLGRVTSILEIESTAAGHAVVNEFWSWDEGRAQLAWNPASAAGLSAAGRSRLAAAGLEPHELQVLDPSPPVAADGRPNRRFLSWKRN
jgi:type IV secretory pathway ATPase VirB11/archaellum biosynthesis ATPase